jgi:hypothetical protein
MQKHVLPLCFGLLAAFALAFIFTACENPVSDSGEKALTGTVAIQKDGAAVTEAELGDELRAVVSGSNAAAFEYLWQKKTGIGAFVNIPGATSSVYRVATPVAADDVIKVIVSATGFTGKKESATVLVKLTVGPDLTGFVVIHKDSAVVEEVSLGDTVTAVAAGLNNDAVPVYQWQKKTGTGDFSNIPDANSISYEIAAPVAVNDEIRVVVTAVGFSKRIESNGVPVIDPNDPPLTGDVTIARDPAGTPVRIGDTVKATIAGLNAGATPLYQWQKKTGNDNYTDITSATSQTYLITETEVSANDYIRVYIRADNHTGRRESNEIQVQIAPALDGAVAIHMNGAAISEAEEGETVNAVVTGSSAASAALKYQWQKKTGDGSYTDIPDATIAAYRIATPVVPGDSVKVLVSAVNFSASIESAPILVTIPLFPVVEDIVITHERVEILPFDPYLNARVGKGRTLQFSAAVSGQHLTVEDEEVTWSVAGTSATASGTGISESGLLTAALAEPNSTLTVTATSKIDTNVAKTIDVQVVTVYIVTFDTDGGTPVESRVIDVVSGNAAIVEAGKTMTLYVGSIGWSYVSTKERSIFSGWMNSGGSLVYSVPSISGDVTLKARWTPAFLVTLDLNGGKLLDGIGDDLPLIYPVVNGGTFDLRDYVPTKDGEVFYGWYLSTDPNQTVLTGARTISADITFKAKWGPGAVFTFDLNGGVYPPDVQTVYHFAPGYRVYLEQYPIPTHPDELAFKGWALSTNLNYVYGRFDSIPIADESPITLVAQWVTGTIVTLNLNGGEFPLPVSGIPVPTIFAVEPAQGANPSPNFNVPTTKPVKEGHSFTGWYLNAELTTPLPVAGIVVRTEPVTIYAGWLDISYVGVYHNSEMTFPTVVFEIYEEKLVVAHFSPTSITIQYNDSMANPIDVATQFSPDKYTDSANNEYLRVTEKKQPAKTTNFALEGRWRWGSTNIYLNLWDDKEVGEAVLSYSTTINLLLSYVVEGNTLYLMRRISTPGVNWYDKPTMYPGELIMSIPIVSNALQGWAK